MGPSAADEWLESNAIHDGANLQRAPCMASEKPFRSSGACRGSKGNGPLTPRLIFCTTLQFQQACLLKVHTSCGTLVPNAKLAIIAKSGPPVQRTGFRGMKQAFFHPKFMKNFWDHRAWKRPFAQTKLVQHRICQCNESICGFLTFELNSFRINHLCSGIWVWLAGNQWRLHPRIEAVGTRTCLITVN